MKKYYHIIQERTGGEIFIKAAYSPQRLRGFIWYGMSDNVHRAFEMRDEERAKAS